MANIKRITQFIILASVLFVAVAAPRQASAAELFTLHTENGMEFYLVDGAIEPVSLDGLFADQSRWTLTSEGSLTDPRWQTARMFTSVRSLTTEQGLAGFRGFRTSFLGHVLEIDAHYADLPRRPATRVAQLTQTEGLQLRSLPAASPRLAWQAREALTILSF